MWSRLVSRFGGRASVCGDFLVVRWPSCSLARAFALASGGSCLGRLSASPLPVRLFSPCAFCRWLGVCPSASGFGPCLGFCVGGRPASAGFSGGSGVQKSLF